MTYMTDYVVSVLRQLASPLIAVCLFTSCSSGSAKRVGGAAPKYSYEVVHVYPHDPEAFTQGLTFRDGKLLESTGQEGRSSLRSVDLDSGQVLKKVDVAPQYFAEGITVMNGKVYQLTWQHHIGFIYNYQTFERIGQFSYEGEGWGLTNDGRSLILSDGSNRLRFLDPDTFRVTRTIAVTDAGKPVNQLNELEYIQGEIFANIWHDQRIVSINPQTGAVTSWIDCSGLISQGETPDQEAVLNGIAFDQNSGRLFVTGKLWPKLFEIKIRK
jgi:glutaminyl-peptide cyclotransferase